MRYLLDSASIATAAFSGVRRTNVEVNAGSINVAYSVVLIVAISAR